MFLSISKKNCCFSSNSLSAIKKITPACIYQYDIPKHNLKNKPYLLFSLDACETGTKTIQLITTEITKTIGRIFIMDAAACTRFGTLNGAGF